MIRISAVDVFAIPIAIMGLIIMVAWSFPIPGFIKSHELMVFNTALCFFILGISLIFRNQSFFSKSVGFQLSSSVVIIISVLTLLESAFNVSFGIDNVFFSSRMATNSAIGFCLSGLMLFVYPSVNNKGWIILETILIVTVFFLGLSALTGYLLNLDVLYSWYLSSRMAPETAIGFVFLALALWNLLRLNEFFQKFYAQREDRKIILLNIIILFSIASIAGLSGFITSSKQYDKDIQNFIKQLFQDKTNLLQNSIDNATAEIKLITKDPDLQAIIFSLNARSNKHPDNFSQMLLNTTFSGIQVEDLKGNLLYSAGKFTKNPMATEITLNNIYPTRLMWNHHFSLQISTKLTDKHTVKIVTFEWPLETFNHSLYTNTFQNNREIFLCFINDNKTGCLPQNIIDQFKELQNFIPKMLNNTHLLNSYNKEKHLLFSFGPIENQKIGFVIKSDLSEIYQPLRKQLAFVIPLLIIAILSGIVLIYWQISPLIHKIRRSSKQAKLAHARLKAVIDHIGEGVITINNQGIIESVNSKMLDIFGYTKNEIVGHNVKKLMPDRFQNQHEAGMKRYLETGYSNIIKKKNIELVGKNKNNNEFPLELSLTEMKMNHQSYFVGIIHDISERKKNEIKIKESESRFRLAFDLSAIGMALIGMDGTWIKVNPALCHILGYSDSELLSMNFKSITHPDDLDSELNLRRELLEKKIAHFELEKRFLNKNGHLIWALQNLTLMTHPNGDPLHFIAQIQDVTKQKQAEAQLNYQAHHDVLTGLANRAQLENDLKRIIELAKFKNKRFALFFMDLDNFKQVNDALGHDAGDRLLKITAERLKNHIRKNDIAARLGGDEFILVLSEIDEPQNAALFAERIKKILQTSMSIKGQEIIISTSIGVSFFPDDGQDAAALIQNADQALYRAKANGRNNYQFCTPEMSKEIKEKLAFEMALQQALAQEEFKIYYLPRLDLFRHCVVGFEAFFQWESETYGTITANNILVNAEETGLYTPIIQWLVKTASSQLKKLHQDKFPSLYLSINLGSQQLLHAQVIESMIDGLEMSGFNYSLFMTEVNESGIQLDPEITLNLLRVIKKQGIKIILAEYKGQLLPLNQIKNISADAIKIDLMTPETFSQEIITLAKKIEIKTIISGVDTKEQYDLCIQKGCNEVQGYFVSKPLLADELLDFLEGQQLSIV